MVWMDGREYKVKDKICQTTEIPLDDLLSMAGIGIWGWNIPNNFVWYNEEALKMMGYSKSEMRGTIGEWKANHHPKDLLRSTQLLKNYLEGNLPTYECEIRIRCQDGNHIWVRNTGKIIARDAQGKPTKLIGIYKNIDELKHLQQRLEQALESLKSHYILMENMAENHAMEIVEQNMLLLTISRISKKILITHPKTEFQELVQDCLYLLGESIGKNRIYIWKDCINTMGKLCCTQIYEWVRGVEPIQGKVQFEEIAYEELPNFEAAVKEDKCLNSLLRDLSDSEKRILEPQGIKTILIAPIAVNGKRWGFIGVDNCKDEQLFTAVEENMILMSGSMLASAIEKRDTEAALREMEERTQIMLNATPLCCNLWTSDFYNMSCNDEAVRLFELSSQQEYLDRFYELSPKYQPCGKLSDELAAKWISKAFQEGYCRFEWLHQKLDGTPIPAEITLVRIKYKDDFIVAGYTRDLREQKAMMKELKTKEALRRARDKALLNSKAKSNFLANMSHEIRTPMNAISGFAEMILREHASETTIEYAKGIKNACNNLINIINDILDISKIESGKLEIFNSSYELASLLNDVITISRMRLGKKPLTFITNIDSKLPAQLIGDEIRIRQILLNILSNAIKFTAEGYIALRVFGVMEGNKIILRFTVRDSGIGIRPEDLERLFEEFERINTTKNRGIEGTGLGLAISKQLCELMGGFIQVESTYGEGSEFTAVIPQEYSSHEPLAQVREKKNVLLYEPREHYRFSIAKSLENLDCNCISCENQLEFDESISILPYDYILTAALYLEKVQDMVQNNRMSVPVAIFAEYEEKVNTGKLSTILSPVNCLQLADLLNGQHDDADFSKHNTHKICFIAPSARVLVVDDNLVNLQVAKGLMEPYKFTVDTAKNGVEAIQMVKQEEYDLVFMDHMMPDMDGVDATIAIRNLEGSRYQNLPIIALTANALVGTREMFIREGMNDFLAKPIELKKLVHILNKWLPPYKLVKELIPEPVKKTEGTESWDISCVDTEKGILMVGGNKEQYLQILSSYYEDNKQKSVSLLGHIRKNDFIAFRTEVHALKSTSATIGAVILSSMAAKLEAAAQKKDVFYINEHIDEFLICLQQVLEEIFTLFPKNQMGEETADKPIGNRDVLLEELDALLEASQLANISRLEKGLNELQAFQWTKEITKGLFNMRKHLNMFDYDEVAECVTQLKESMSNKKEPIGG